MMADPYELIRDTLEHYPLYMRSDPQLTTILDTCNTFDGPLLTCIDEQVKPHYRGVQNTIYIPHLGTSIHLGNLHY